MTLLGLLLAVAAAGALVLAVVAAPGPGFDLGLIGLSIVGALLAGIVLSIDHRRLREHEPPLAPRDDGPRTAPRDDELWTAPQGGEPRNDEPRAPLPSDWRPPGAGRAVPRTAPAGSGDSVRVAWALADESEITPELREELLAHFGSWRALSAASVEELEEAPGVGYTLARRIRAALDR